METSRENKRDVSNTDFARQLSFDRNICLISKIIWSHCLILLFDTLVVWLHTLCYDDWSLNSNTWWHVVPIIAGEIIYADLVNLYSSNIQKYSKLGHR